MMSSTRFGGQQRFEQAYEGHDDRMGRDELEGIKIQRHAVQVEERPGIGQPDLVAHGANGDLG